MHRYPDDPVPTDPPFLFVILLAAKKSGDTLLESQARRWLADIGIRVVFARELPPPSTDKAVRHA